MKYINKEQHPYGENAIVAIMVYGGYNVEDAVLVSQGAIDRGIFRTTYLNSYETKHSYNTLCTIFMTQTYFLIS